MKVSGVRIELRIALLFALFAGAWIFFSDMLLGALVTDPVMLTRAQTLKGWFFVALSAALIYGLARWHRLADARAQEKLRESAERFTKIFHSSPAPISIVRGSDARFVDVNDAFVQLLGYARQEVVGRTAEELGLWANPAERAALIQTFRERGFVSPFEWVYRRKSGETGSALASVVLMDLRGETHVLTQFVDITERKRIEQARRDAETKYRSLVESVPAIVYSSELGNLIAELYISPQTKSILGFDAQEWLATPGFWLSHVHPADRERIKTLLIGCDETRTPFCAEYRMIGAEGQVVWFHDEATPIELPGGTHYWQGIMLDITEHKRAQELLQTNQEFLEVIYNNTDIGIFVVAVSASGEFRYESINPKHEILLGLKNSAVAGKTPDDLIPYFGAENINAAKALYSECVQARKTIESEFYFSEGAARGWWFSRITPLFDPATDRVTRLIGTGVVITARKQAEEALQHSHARLRELTQRVAQVQEDERRALARELHDRVGQTLTALNLNLNIMRAQLSTDAAAKIGPRLDDSIQLVEETVQRVRDVMADLYPPVLADYGLAAALRWYAEQFARRTELDVRVDAEGADKIRLAPYLEAVLFRSAQELLTNAARHARAKQVAVKLQPLEHAARLCVEDDGRGFDPAQIAAADQRAGWGLLTMRERIEAVGGTFTLETGTGQGTRVVVKVSMTSPPTPLLKQERGEVDHRLAQNERGEVDEGIK